VLVCTSVLLARGLGGIPPASTHLPKETLMRAPAVLAAIALAGTVLLGGAAQALADDHDDVPTNDVGNVNGGQFGPASHSKSDFDSGATGFGEVGGTFDGASGH
jgi:hypothetical protein